MRNAAKVKLLANFDDLPDDSLVALPIASAALDLSESLMKRRPPIKRVQLSARCIRFRVGDIRNHVRGQPAAA